MQKYLTLAPVGVVTSLLIIAALLTGCDGLAQYFAQPTVAVRWVTPTQVDPTGVPTEGATPEATLVETPAQPTATPDLRLLPEQWREWPVVPEVISPRTIQIYQQGLAQGNHPNAFSKIGDCQNVNSLFLAVFEKPGEYRLGDWAYLQPTIDHFTGSFSRQSVAVRGGMNVAAVLSPLQANKELCDKNESPLDCELRINNPSMVLISMETNWSKRSAATYEKYMRQILDKVIASGAVPILATKADDLEGGHTINLTIAQLAYEYDIPLWNFWAAVQPLSNHGLQPDGFHLTVAANYYDNKQYMKEAWPWRNLTALQTIDAVWRGCGSIP
jgi:hypothetical protein